MESSYLASKSTAHGELSIAARIGLACILSIAIGGCGGCASDDDAPLDGSTPTPDAAGGLDGAMPGPDAAIDGGRAEDGGTPDGLQVERWGARMHGSVVALSPIGGSMWIGTNLVEDPYTREARAGLFQVDVASGAVRVWEDELPILPSPGLGEPSGPSPTAGALEVDGRMVVVGRMGLLTVEGSTITEHRLVGPDGVYGPTEAVLAGDTLWVATSGGLFALDPTTFAERDLLDPSELGGLPGALAADPATGDLYVVVLDESGVDGSVALVRGGSVVATLDPATVTGVGGARDVVFSASERVAYVAVASWHETYGGVVSWDGTTATWIASEGELTEGIDRSQRPLGTSVLALAEDDRMLIVGGQIRGTPLGILEGGGLVYIDLSQLPSLAVGGLTTSGSGLAGEHVTALAYEPVSNATWIAAWNPCNERRLGFAGLDTVRFEAGKPRFGKPILGGVRGMAMREGEVWLGLRDDQPGLRCQGLNIQQGLVALRSNRSGTVVDIPAPVETAWHPNRVGPSIILPGADDQLVLFAKRGDIYIGTGTRAMLQNPTGLGPALQTHDAVWQTADTFWFGGRASHNELDPPNLADVGPRGAARVTLVAGSIDRSTHYVRATRDPAGPDTVTGLPSSDVRAIVPDGDAVWLVSGIERFYAGEYDRNDGRPYLLDGEQRLGGVTRVEADGTLQVIDAGPLVPDGRAAALDASGTLHVLDAQNGLLRLEGDTFTSVALPVAVPAEAIPQTLWMGEGGAMVLGYDLGALVTLDGESEWLEGFGFVWNAMQRADGVLLLGTDEGLLRVRSPSTPPVAEPPPSVGELPAFVVVRDGGTSSGDPDAGVADGGVGTDAGSCKGEREICSPAAGECCPGLACAGSGFVTECVPI